MESLFETFNPLLIASIVGGMALFALFYAVTQFASESKSTNDVKKRLSAKASLKPSQSTTPEDNEFDAVPNSDTQMSKVAQKANSFYANNDPKSIKKLRMMLMKAGYMDPNAVGYFIAARFILGTVGLLIGVVLISTVFAQSNLGPRILTVVSALAVGYFLPNLYLNRRSAAVEQSNRQGFPDILDLMVVSAEAGLTMEASITRIAQEIKDLYPILAMQLNLASLEIRAGRPIDQALRAFGERLSLEEVKGFATMVQQAKELGTSVSDALRVYSDEMRHKRMMKAEEKAYALPAKMSVPVTLFILPIVIGIAIIPTIVRWN